MTSKDKRIGKDYIHHTSILKRARKLYKSGSKVFDEGYLKDNEERVLQGSKFRGLSRDDIEEVLQERDYAIMANNVFHRLCTTPEEWHDIKSLAEEVRAFDNEDDVAHIAETVLLDMQFIERDPHTNNVRLTPLGRQNCARGIAIPPSDIQRLKRLQGMI
jgi:hypothetical protein